MRNSENYLTSLRLACLVAISVTCLLACSDNITCPTGVVDQNDGVAVLTIGPVFDKTTGDRIDAFTVSDISLNGTPLAGDGSITCTTTCGFGTEPGSYTFTVSTPSAGSATFTMAADYTISSLSGHAGKGCYTRLERHGTELAVSL